MVDLINHANFDLHYQLFTNGSRTESDPFCNQFNFCSTVTAANISEYLCEIIDISQSSPGRRQRQPALVGWRKNRLVEQSLASRASIKHMVKRAPTY